MPECKRRVPLAIAIFGLFVAGCEPSELRPVPVGFPESGGFSAPSRPAPLRTAQPKPSAPSMPMIDNPDAEAENDSEIVWATDEYEAQRKCEEIARSRSDRRAIVTVQGKPQRLTQTASRYGSYKFLCTLRIEYQ